MKKKNYILIVTSLLLITVTLFSWYLFFTNGVYDPVHEEDTDYDN